MTWMQTRGGAAFDLVRPRVDGVNFSDIAYALARLPRFNGHTLDTWTVAHHSLYCLDLLLDLHPDASPELQAYVLLHDAHEAYTGDITTPMQRALDDVLPGARAALKEIQERIQAAIHIAFGVAVDLDERETEIVKQIDMLALAGERVAFMMPCDRPWDSSIPPAPRLECRQMDADAAEIEFTAALFDLDLRVSCPLEAA